MAVFAFWVFVAGLLSFLSPCVLPLVPGYVTMLSGIGMEQLKEGEGSSSKLLTSAFSFVIGFSAVFVAMGATASAVGSFLSRNRDLLVTIAGAFIILFGLHLIGWLAKISIRVGLIAAAVLLAGGLALQFEGGSIGFIRPVHFYSAAAIFLIGPKLTRWLNRDVHMQNVGGSKPGIISGFLMGFAFALGWTPCIGPILAGVLAIAATRAKVTEGVILLVCYSAGLAIPFLLTAVGIGRFLKFYQKFRRHLHTVEVVSGVVLLLVGLLFFGPGLTAISRHMGNMAGLEELIPKSALQMLEGPANGGTKQAEAANLQPEPNVTFKGLQGEDISLASYKGKVVLVNMWGTWCEPCRGEIPTLIKMQQDYSNQGFTILGVATNDDVDRVVPFIHDTKFPVGGQELTMNYPIVMGSDQISSAFGGLLGMPTSFLIDRQGDIVKRYIGSLNPDEINKDVKAQL
ncbi:MAG: redoxin domain-containing protein [Acidobacteriota bacterium]|nr:redoxin domain-containing protein [Acidobacteriota bacterium]MDE3168841.1 redoxin domain-containing protein [Acidobacteriota bacterium]